MFYYWTTVKKDFKFENITWNVGEKYDCGIIRAENKFAAKEKLEQRIDKYYRKYVELGCLEVRMGQVTNVEVLSDARCCDCEYNATCAYWEDGICRKD